MSRKNEEKSQQALAENQDDAIQMDDQTVINAQESAEQPTREKAGSDDKNSQTAVEKTGDASDPAAEERPADMPRLESLSVLADRHRIPAWHQAALLRYMGWQDDKMVTDEDYRKALDGLKHRRIGGGRMR